MLSTKTLSAGRRQRITVPQYSGAWKKHIAKKRQAQKMQGSNKLKKKFVAKKVVT